jgi:hypothetical protein
MRENPMFEVEKLVDLKNNIKVAAKASFIFVVFMLVVSKFNTTRESIAFYCIAFVFLTLLIFAVGSIIDALKGR